MRARLAGALALVALGLAGGQAAQAAPLAGVLPVGEQRFFAEHGSLNACEAYRPRPFTAEGQQLRLVYVDREPGRRVKVYAAGAAVAQLIIEARAPVRHFTAINTGPVDVTYAPCKEVA